VKGLIYATLAFAVMGLSVWAYQENYHTQAALRELRNLRAELARAEARLDRLYAEWAWLNRPDRLRELALVNFGRLELLPLPPEAFASVEEVAYPPTLLGPIGSPLAVSSDGALPGGEEPL
jgi:hypothetical protein